MAKTAENTNEALKRMVRQILHAPDPAIVEMEQAEMDRLGIARRAGESVRISLQAINSVGVSFRDMADTLELFNGAFLSPSYPLVPMLSLSILWAIEQADRAREEREEPAVKAWSNESEEALF